jgi:hypothetical protein
LWASTPGSSADPIGPLRNVLRDSKSGCSRFAMRSVVLLHLSFAYVARTATATTD